MNVLFVCLGNICRSPLAEAVFAGWVGREGLSKSISVDSAGTAGYHTGELADPRSRTTARRHGLTIPHRARPVVPLDYERFDLLIAMDESNRSDLRRRAPHRSFHPKIRLFRDWDPAGPGDIPDPYYGTDEDFESVWDLCHRSSPGLLFEIRSKERL